MISKLLYSIRPSACLGVALLAVAAFQNIDEMFTITTIFLAVFSGAAACFLINDIHDREKDLLNDKKRPIATGSLPTHIAVSSAVSFSLFYLGLSVYLGWMASVIAGITLISFITYHKINNRFGLLANIVVAVNVVLALVYGGLLREFDTMVQWMMISAFFVTISREIMLDALDTKGDEAVGKSSVPLMSSKRTTSLFILAGYILGSIPLIFLVSDGTLNAIFIITMLVALWIPLLVHLVAPKFNWILFNVRSTHTYFGLMIALLFLR